MPRRTKLPRLAQSAVESELTAMQDRLVEAMLCARGSALEAIREAGYKDPSAGYRALRSNAVQQELMRRARAALVADVGLALATRRELLTSNSDHVRLDAAKDILNRAGLVTDAAVAAGPTGQPVRININLAPPSIEEPAATPGWGQ